MKLQAENPGTEAAGYSFFSWVYLQGITWSQTYGLSWVKHAGIPDLLVELDPGETKEYTLIYSLTNHIFMDRWTQILEQDMYLSFSQGTNKKMVLLEPR